MRKTILAAIALSSLASTASATPTTPTYKFEFGRPQSSEAFFTESLNAGLRLDGSALCDELVHNADATSSGVCFAGLINGARADLMAQLKLDLIDRINETLYASE
ncbi:MAG: hypothetical protein GC152_00340 [Alphaproteobacteria bacterium]|nr:hypothetical protein [Alphaproteobacteria bacterium]